MTLTTTAFVIKKNDFNESDKIVTFLTKDFGKISALGKFAKKSIKRNLNLLDFGYLLKIQLNYNSSNEIYFIEKVTVMEQFLNKSFYRKFLIFSFINELLYYVVYGTEESAMLFMETYKFFKKLSLQNNDKRENLLSLLSLFKIKLLNVIGYKIVIDRCVLCGKEENIYDYSLEKMGFICNRCTENRHILRINKGTKKVLANIDKNIKISMPIVLQLDKIFNANIEKIVTANGYNKINNLYTILNNEI